jgi:Zn finger protein HypA/HybF involved in hydrogenase expression
LPETTIEVPGVGNLLEGDERMKLKLDLAKGQPIEFDDDAVDVLCPKCSDWFELDLHKWNHQCPICKRGI